MRFDILTLFPESIDRFLSESIIGRARDKGILDINAINIRDFSQDKHRKTDDYPYGGGAGMVMTPSPFMMPGWCGGRSGLQAKDHLYEPQGRLFNQRIAQELGREAYHLYSGHYEAWMNGFLRRLWMMKISIGDYVLTGGELPAMVLIDCVSRLVDGVLTSEESIPMNPTPTAFWSIPSIHARLFSWKDRCPRFCSQGHHANIESGVFADAGEDKGQGGGLYALYEEQNKEK